MEGLCELFLTKSYILYKRISKKGHIKMENNNELMVEETVVAEVDKKEEFNLVLKRIPPLQARMR